MEKLYVINEYLEKVGAKDIKIFDLRGVSSLFDFVFIATVDVARQAAALVDYINKAKKTNEIDFRNINGEGSNWTLVDLNDILLNIFTYEERIHYDLERLYVNSPLIVLEKREISDVKHEVIEKVVKEVIEEVIEEVVEHEEYSEIEEIEEIEEFIEIIEEVEEIEEQTANVKVDLNSLTIPGLKALCKQYKLKGYSTLKKQELIQLLSDNLI